MQNNNNIVSKSIWDIKAYIPGKPIEDVKRDFKLTKVVKLASNENPFGCSPTVLPQIVNQFSRINRYPDGACFYLKKALANFLNIDEKFLIFGNGSDELIDVLIKTFVDFNQEIITANTTFLEYKVSSQVNRRKIIEVPLKDFKFDLGAIAKKISKKTKMIFIANPNNPTGTYLNNEEVVRFLINIPKGIITVFDEAYFEFVDADDFPQLMKFIVDKNVILLRTFSKIYGLAGLRLGYGIANEEFISVLNRVRQPFNVNSIAQAAGIAALKDQKFVKFVQDKNVEGRKFLYEEFKKIGLEFIPTQANFILVNLKRDGVATTRNLIKKGLIIRDMEQYGLKNYVRITIGKKEENKFLIRELRRIL